MCFMTIENQVIFLEESFLLPFYNLHLQLKNKSLLNVAYEVLGMIVTLNWILLTNIILGCGGKL